MDAQTVTEVVTLLEKLANGDTVALGEFDDSGLLGDDPAGQQAEVLREVADMLRTADVRPEYKRCEQCGERGTDDNPTYEICGEIWCYECESEAGL
jgi:hypothetical protein